MGASLTIGDFSRMTHLSIKTLRHYHQVGLLEPIDVDPVTGYRHYDTDQVPTAQVIRRFRDLEMPVDEVRAVLEAPDLATRNALISSHLDRLERHLDATQAAVASLRTLLERPDAPIAITHRSVPGIAAAAIRATVSLNELGRWWSTAFEEIDQLLTRRGMAASGPRGGLYGSDVFVHERGEATVYVPVNHDPPSEGRVESLVIPAAELAVARHDGPHHDIDRTYGALGTYVAQHRLGVDGPVREAYLVSEFDTADPGRWRTEIGWPIFHTSVT
jgi:DNA-binding transcriptional MerR regulator